MYVYKKKTGLHKGSISTPDIGATATTGDVSAAGRADVGALALNERVAQNSGARNQVHTAAGKKKIEV